LPAPHINSGIARARGNPDPRHRGSRRGDDDRGARRARGRAPPTQQALIDQDAFQCGYCTPGQILSAFGWSRRDPEPGSTRDGDWLAGWCCAATMYPTQMGPATARVTLMPQGTVKVQTAAHD
jgi:xanthine dehydrogenase iron-sulfur cluster and FAD-binding subunit A